MQLGHVLQQTTGTSQLVKSGIEVVQIELALGNSLEHVLKGDSFHLRYQLADGNALHFQGLGNLVAKPGVLHLGVKESQFLEWLAGYRGNVAQLADNFNALLRSRSHGKQGLSSIGNIPELKGCFGGVDSELFHILSCRSGIAHHDFERKPGLLHAGCFCGDSTQGGECPFDRSDGSTDCGKGGSELPGQSLDRFLGLADFALNLVQGILQVGGIPGECECNVSHVWSGISIG